MTKTGNCANWSKFTAIATLKWILLASIAAPCGRSTRQLWQRSSHWSVDQSWSLKIYWNHWQKWHHSVSFNAFLACYHHVLQHMFYHMLSMLMLSYSQASLDFLVCWRVLCTMPWEGKTFDLVDILYVSGWVDHVSSLLFFGSASNFVLLKYNYQWSNGDLLNLYYRPTTCSYIYLQPEILRINFVVPIWKALGIITTNYL